MKGVYFDLVTAQVCFISIAHASIDLCFNSRMVKQETLGMRLFLVRQDDL